MNYLYDENTIFKLEFPPRRRQPAGVRVDERGSDIKGYSKSNQLLGASVVVKF